MSVVGGTETETVEVSLPGDARLLIRAQRINEEELVRTGEGDQGPADVGLADFLHFGHVTSSIRAVAAELHKALQAAQPDVVSIELGFDLAVEGSQLLAVVVDAGAHAKIKVRLEWHNMGNLSSQSSSAALDSVPPEDGPDTAES